MDFNESMFGPLDVPYYATKTFACLFFFGCQKYQIKQVSCANNMEKIDFFHYDAINECNLHRQPNNGILGNKVSEYCYSGTNTDN